MVEFELPEKYTRASVIAFVQNSNNLISIYSGLHQMVELVDIELKIIQTELDIDFLQTSPTSYQADPERAKLLSKQNYLAELCAKRTQIQTRELVAARDLAKQLLEQTDKLAKKYLPDLNVYNKQKTNPLYGKMLTSYIASKSESDVPAELLLLLPKATELFTGKMTRFHTGYDRDNKSIVQDRPWCVVDPAEVLKGISYE